MSNKPPDIPPIEPVTMSPRAMAAALMLTPRRVQQLVAEGVLPEPVDGAFSTASVISAYLTFLRDAPARASGASEASRALSKARAAQVDAAIARQARDLVPAPQAIAFARWYSDTMLGMIEGLGDAMAPADRRRLLGATAAIRVKMAELLCQHPGAVDGR